MKRFAISLALAGVAMAQTPPKVEFKVASVRSSSNSVQDSVAIGVHVDGAQVRINSLPLRDYIARAYRVKLYQVEGPSWLSSERFDVSAKLPAGASQDQIPEMLQALLAERFQLKIHRDKKDLPVYALLQGKPPLKIKESEPDPPGTERKATNVAVSGSAAGVSVDLGGGSYYTFANGKFEAGKITMDMLGRQLERYLDRPIVDMTGLTGRYDLAVTVTQEDAQTMLIRAAVNAGVMLPPQALQLLETGSVASLLDGLNQLGLKVDQRKAPLDLIVVDSALTKPADN